MGLYGFIPYSCLVCSILVGLLTACVCRCLLLVSVNLSSLSYKSINYPFIITFQIALLVYVVGCWFCGYIL